MIQLYGHTHDYGSFSNVSRAIARELVRHHMLAVVYPIGERTLRTVEPYLQRGLDSTARVGIYVGYPEGGASWLNGHAERVMVTVCETDRIPYSWVEACNTATLIVVPSEWCQAAFLRSGVKVPVEIVPHGLWPLAAAPVETLPDALTLLHVSGSLSFAERKGTAQLLRAFRAFVDEHLDARLLLKVPNTQGLQRALAEVDLIEHVDVLPDETLDPQQMARLLRRVHGVVQPSRAEGFGLVPLEARRVGTPVIVTHCTGHLEHAEVYDTVVAHGALATVETQANPVGAAPTVTTESVKAALDSFASSLYTSARVSRQHARSSEFDEWQWERVLAPLMKTLRKRDERRHLRLGSGAGLRGTS